MAGRAFTIPSLIAGTQASAEIHTYFAAAEEVLRDYAPEGKDMLTGRDFTEDQNVFVVPGASGFGNRYK